MVDMLSCPACATQFAVPDGLVAQLADKPRRLRCSRCGHVWQQGGAPPPLAPPPSPAAPDGGDTGPPNADTAPAEEFIDPVAARRARRGTTPRTAPPPRPTMNRATQVVYGVAGLILLLALLLALFAPLSPLAKTEPTFLDVSIVYAGMRRESGELRLVLDGVLANNTGQPVAVPALALVARDSDGKMMDEWPIPLSTTTLVPGASLPLSVVTRAPSEPVHSLTVNHRHE